MSKSARPGLPEIPDFSMIVDHPFLVLVRAPPAHGHHLHHASAGTGALLFVGQVSRF